MKNMVLLGIVSHTVLMGFLNKRLHLFCSEFLCRVQGRNKITEFLGRQLISNV